MFGTTLQALLYKNVAKPILFRMEPEAVHDRVLSLGKILGKTTLTRNSTAFLFRYKDAILTQKILGMRFLNPIGLAAGFDKNAELTHILSSVGFGFAEVGSITGEYCDGNAKPRLWRHPEIHSLRVYYGLKNDGCERIAKRLSEIHFDMPIGTSVAKTNCKETVGTDAAIRDYLKAYRTLRRIGEYDTINISCPNVYGGQPFTDPSRLESLLRVLNEHRNPKPMLLKLSPDLSTDELHTILSVAKKYKVDGIICSNLRKEHDLGKGGLSGKAVAPLACKQLEYVSTNFPDTFVLISCGGVFSGEDAYKRIRCGASLIQLATGMIYQGPQVIGDINRTLARLLRRDGFGHISEAVGVNFS